MIKKSFLITFFIFPLMAFLALIVPQFDKIFCCNTIVFGQNIAFKSSQNNELITKYQKLSPQQLLDTATFYFNNNFFDRALLCYNLLIKTSAKDADLEQQKRVVEATNKSASIYYYMCDYRQAYELYIKALLLCEDWNHKSYEPRIYNNIGNIYYCFNNFDVAKLYYAEALSMCQDTIVLVVLYNNLGAVELEKEKIDSAFHYLNKALQMCKQHANISLQDILRNLARCYQQTMRYDSAYYYYHLSLEESRKNITSGKECEAENFSDLGKMFFEINKPDSALFYIGLSNKIAQENNFLKILSENYLIISKEEESKGNLKSAFEHHKIYANLKDSILSNDVFGDINQLQRMYEVSKTDQQIEQLAIEKQVHERTIKYQQIIWFITLSVLLLVSSGLLYIYLQNRKLNRAYQVLVEKNFEIVKLQENASKKYNKSVLPDNVQDELLDKILNVMEDTSVICDTDFSLDKLAELLNTNHVYVSQVINSALKKNFRSFLNSYRIQEAQRLLATNLAQKYTIETIALQIGFKSQTAFREAFKELTGVNPYFYLKSLQQELEGKKE